MFELINGMRSILEACSVVKPKEKVLVLADNEGGPIWIGQIVMNLVNSMGAEAVLIIKNPEWNYENEPPAPVAAAMKAVNAFICISDKATVVHTNARKEATALGVRYCGICQIPLEDLKRGISAPDAQRIKARTETLAQRLTRADTARVTSPSGTDITFRLHGREALALHPLSMVASLPYYAESAIAPVEGTAQGLIVADLAFSSSNNILRQPVSLTVKEGRVSEISGSDESVGRLREIASSDKNSSNIAELGIGTSHVIPAEMHGTRRDYARTGTAHIAFGKNNDIGGQTWSHIHVDALFGRPTIILDDEYVIRDGKFLI